MVDSYWAVWGSGLPAMSSFDASQTSRPRPTPNHSVANRIRSVAEAAVLADRPSSRVNIPAILASAAINPPGKAEIAPTMVENASTKTAIPRV